MPRSRQQVALFTILCVAVDMAVANITDETCEGCVRPQLVLMGATCHSEMPSCSVAGMPFFLSPSPLTLNLFPTVNVVCTMYEIGSSICWTL